MNEFTKKKHFIGIDISKDHLDFALIDMSVPDVYRDKQVANSYAGFGKIKNWLAVNRQTSKFLVAFIILLLVYLGYKKCSELRVFTDFHIAREKEGLLV